MDTPETLAAALVKAAIAAPVAAKAVVSKGSLNVKNDAKKNVLETAPVRNAGAHRAITYEVIARKTSILGVIGYDKDKPGGALGNILEYGGGGDASPPHRDLGRALDEEEPRFLNALGDVAVAGLTGRSARRLRP